LINTQDRKYQKIKEEVKRFIQKNKKIDHSITLNEMNVDYDTLMQILRELKNKGHLN
jgi:biopolymer transport protein ExbD